MAAEPEGPEAHFAPLRTGGWIIRKVPMRRPPAAPEPSENHAEDLSSLVYLQFRGFGCRGVRSRNALAGRVELKPVKRTDEATVAYLTADLRPQVRA